MKKISTAIRGNGFCFFIFSVLFCTGISMPVRLMAQDTLKADSSVAGRQLKEVQIMKLKISRRQSSSTPLQILSGEELGKLNSLSVADAVRYFSGVQLKDYGGIGGLKTINVRSLGTNHTAVFYDGVQLGNAQNGQVDLGKYSLDNIEEIELYNGQKSEVFQSARGFASANSLYLKAREPEFGPEEKEHFKAALKSGSFGLFNPSVLWQRKLSEKVYSTISSEWRRANGKYKFRYTNGVYDTTAVRNNGDVDALRFEAGLNGRGADSSVWNAKIYVYNDEMGLPGAIVGNRFNYEQRLWNRNFFAQGSYQKDISRKYSLLGTAKYAYDFTRYRDPEFVTTNGLLNNRFRQQELYVSLANRYKVSSFWTMVLSGDYQWNTLDANLYRFPYPTRNTGLIALATEFRFPHLDIQANLLGTFVDDQVKNYTAAGSRQELTPTVMFSWQPFDQKEFRLRSFYKRIFRMPTFNDLYYTMIGSTFLRPEYTTQYDLGVTYIKAFEQGLLKQVSLQTDVYYNEVKDKIVAVPGTNGFRWSMANLDEVEIKGLDVNLQTSWQISGKLNLNTGVSYTYQQAEDVTPGSFNYERQIPYVPKHNGSLLLGGDWKSCSFNYSFIYVGERYNQKSNTVYNYVQPWYTHDIAFHYQLGMERRKMRLTAEVNNLFNQYYDVIENFPMPGRSYRFTLSYQY